MPSSGDLMTRGVSTMISSVRRRVSLSDRKRPPMKGMSPRNGIFISRRSLFSSINPPITTVSPSLTVTVVSAVRLMMIGLLNVSLISVVCSLNREIVGRMSMRTNPSGLIVGRTSKMIPISCAVTVVLCVPVSNVAIESGSRISLPT